MDWLKTVVGGIKDPNLLVLTAIVALVVYLCFKLATTVIQIVAQQIVKLMQESLDQQKEANKLGIRHAELMQQIVHHQETCQSWAKKKAGGAKE